MRCLTAASIRKRWRKPLRYNEGWVRPGGAAAGAEYHTVTQGETLWGIAQSRGMSLGQLLVLNPQLKNPNRISEGQRLRVK